MVPSRNQRRSPQAADRPARGNLSREKIARAALDILDRDGLDALSMRAIAAELGVGTMTLYGYFRTKEELLDAAVDVAVEEVDVTTGTGSWKDQLRELMRGIRAALARHPGGIRLRLVRPILSPGALRFTESGLQILEHAGFDREAAVRAYQTLFFYTFGVASFGSPEAPEDVKRQARAALMALPPDEYPALTAAAREAPEALAGEEQFEFGLDCLLEGLEARLRETTATD